jgi:hypothetical protein
LVKQQHTVVSHPLSIRNIPVQFGVEDIVPIELGVEAERFMKIKEKSRVINQRKRNMFETDLKSVRTRSGPIVSPHCDSSIL